MTTYAVSTTQTYSDVDVEHVIRRVTTDLRMIADSSGAITRIQAEIYGYDIEYLAQKGYLQSVDVTLLSYGQEIKAAHYTVNTAAGDLTPSRPGGVLWPRLAGATLRIVITYTPAWWALSESARTRIHALLKTTWTPTTADTSHATLTVHGGRAFVSNAYGIERQDYA